MTRAVANRAACDYLSDFGIECESYRPDNAEKAAQCVKFFDQLAGLLLRERLP